MVGERRENEEALTARKYSVSFGSDKYVAKLIVMMTQFCDYTKHH